LPFAIHLQKFSKVDYPGTETAMSFESDITVNSEANPIKISMNEPLQRAGFTIYQASYILGPNQDPVSIFSVNRDPGRILKYFGSLILCLGIIVFTLMRSNFYRQWKARRSGV
jgi:cytochrome c biogenesis protein ResB